MADPFMGGGTPLLEANRLGCNVSGTDINPMSPGSCARKSTRSTWWPTRRQPRAWRSTWSRVSASSTRLAARVTGRDGVDVKYFMWVKTGTCSACGEGFDLFPGYTLAEDTRHPAYVLVCHSCGDLNEVADPKKPGKCGCGVQLKTEGPVKRNKCACPHCGHVNAAPFHGEGPPTHRLFAMEYHNPELKDRPGRLFKKPDADDLARVEAAGSAWKRLRPSFVPDDAIPGR